MASGREWRGGQRQVHLLARGLAAEGTIDSTVITGAGTPLAERLLDDGLTVSPVGWAMGLDPRVMTALLAASTPGTIVHAHDSHSHTLADAAARFRPVLRVVTRRLELPIRRPQRWQRVSRAIALSNAIATRLVDAGMPTERITVIPPAIDLDSLDRQPPWPDDLPTRPERLVVCIAALTPEKGVDLLIEAAAALRAHAPDLHWMVVGKGPEHDRLNARARALGVADLVSFTGERRDPEAILAHANVAIQPSRSEGFGSSVLDALALGVPVVATGVGGLPEALVAGGGLVVPGGSAMALAEGVRMVLDDRALAAELSAAGRSAVERFSLPRMVSSTIEVYRSLAMSDSTG